MQKRILAPLASVSALALAVAVGPAVAHTGNQQAQSSADITVEDCLVESSKDISYIAYYDDGEQIDKQEFDDEGGTFDLTTVEDIDDVDTVEVKAGTTIDEFDVDCAATDDTSTDDGTTGDGTTDDGTEEDDTSSDRDRWTSQGNSESDITLEDCLVESSKDISYIAFYDDGEQIEKQEFDDEGGTFDLSSVDGIDSIDEIDVKAGTTLETFAVDCPTEPAGDQDGEETSPDETDDGTEDDGDTDDGQTDGSDTDDGDTDDGETDTRDSSEATITVEGCLVESSKDISYIAYYDDGTQVDKENINSETFDLSTVDGIEDIDSIEVKSGTTVEDFAIDCTSGEESTGTSGDQSEDTEKSDDTTSDDGSDSDDEHDGTDHESDDDERTAAHGEKPEDDEKQKDERKSKDEKNHKSDDDEDERESDDEDDEDEHESDDDDEDEEDEDDE